MPTKTAAPEWVLGLGDVFRHALPSWAEPPSKPEERHGSWEWTVSRYSTAGELSREITLSLTPLAEEPAEEGVPDGLVVEAYLGWADASGHLRRFAVGTSTWEPDSGPAAAPDLLRSVAEALTTRASIASEKSNDELASLGDELESGRPVAETRVGAPPSATARPPSKRKGIMLSLAVIRALEEAGGAAITLGEIAAAVRLFQKEAGDDSEERREPIDLLAGEQSSAIARGFAEARRKDPGAALDSLSQQEMEVLRLLANGLSNDEIGSRLDLSTSAVKRVITHLFAQLGVRNRMEAARVFFHLDPVSDRAGERGSRS